VSSQKTDVHKAISNADKGIFPYAFCKITEDFFGNDEAFCNIMHADGAGTKSSLAYLYWKETGDISVFKGIAQDSLVMNLDDVLCTGTNATFLLSNTIGRNKHLIPGEVIKAIIEGYESCAETLDSFGINVQLTGGETADVGDLVRTVIVDSTLTCRPKKADIIENNIQPGNVIVGFASYGHAVYEDIYNSGIGSNGLTSGRHDLLHHQYYSKYPETFDPKTDEDLIYSGPFSLTDHLKETPLDIGKALLSPTRTYAPILNKIFQDAGLKNKISGIIHCTGGAQTKVMKFLQQPVHVVKSNLLPIPPLFQTIQEVTNTSWREMYEVYNCGHRLEIYCDLDIAEDLVTISKSLGVGAQIIGEVRASETPKLTVMNENYENLG
jgi:phosphoribosylformylglycinamidine cyclo-ligase